jgi:hypothetical protein
MELHQTLLEKELDEMFVEVRKRAADLSKSSKRRLRGAYLLKIVAAGGGLFIATGLLPEVHQAIGIAVLVAVFMDSVFSNHDRLVSELEAGYAFDALGTRVKREYNREASSLNEAAENGDAIATAQIEALRKKAHTELDDGLAKIKEGLHARNVAALRSLSLESERASVRAG